MALAPAPGVPPNRRVNTFDIFVGNLPPDADQKKVGKVFSRFGEIQGIFVKDTGDGNKFAFVKFFCEEDSLRAIEDTNGTLFEGGKVLSVKKAIKRGPPRKEGEQDGGQMKDDSKPQFPMKQGNPDIVPSFEGIQDLGKREPEKILISHVETPVILWGQRMNQQTASELGSITEQLSIICPEAPKLIGKPEADKMYGAQFSEDGQWYRCVVRYVFSNDRVKVQYIDFGNTEELNPSELVELPKSLSAMPVCGIKLMLHSLWCNNNQDQNAIKFLRDLVEGQEVDVTTTARLSDHTGFYAEVFFNGISICEKMVEVGHCFRKTIDQRGFKARPHNVGDVSNSAGPMKQGGFIQREMPRKFEGDKDENSSLRWKLKNLQTEYTTLSNKAQENDLTKQIKNLQMLAATVRKLRNQFPLDKPTPLDTAVSLVQCPGKISLDRVQCLPEVITAINAYRGAQDEIRKCSDGTILTEKIDTRNELRKDLHDKLESFISEISSLPLQDRGKEVQEVVSSMSKHYDTFTKVAVQSLPTLDSLLPAYEEWKEKKKIDVIDAQRNSDTMESTVSALLSQLQSLLSLNVTMEAEEPMDDLATTLRAYKDALQNEISTWDSDNNQDTMVISSLVQVLLQDLLKESTCVEQLNKMLEEFTNLQSAIAKWLDTSPSLDALLEVRKKLKSLKSKLRHMLADKVDAEENHDTEELESIKEGLEILRAKIHKALKEEDKLLGELGQLASEHFPELLGSEQDSGFGSYLTYKGIVKDSQAPDQFTLTPVDDTQTNGLFLSTFDEEPVYIREYFLSDGNHLDREEFLSQMGLFTNASSPFLEPVQAIFFDKNNRHAYVQVKKEGELLSTALKQSVLSKQQAQDIVRCLCVALQALHQFNFVHGQIQPEYVMLDSEGNARLLPTDFSLTDGDRCRSKFMTESSLEMTAPEMKQSIRPVEPSHAIDVYCLGLLALWMHYPQHQFPENKNGVVDISGVQMDRNLGIFLTKLLCPNPLLRPSAENCLRSEYLTQPVDRPPSSTPPMQKPLVQTMFGSPSPQDMYNADVDQSLRGTRNSASPCSSDGLVFADNVAGVQVIANTRVPPPQLMGDIQTPNMGMSPLAMQQQQGNPALSMAPDQPQSGSPSLAAQQLMQQQLLQQQQLQMQLQQQQLEQEYQASQQLQQQQQQEQQQQKLQQEFQASQQREQVAAAPPPRQSGVFEIGTFDPNAYEVVTSPQPPTANLTDAKDFSEAGEGEEGFKKPGHKESDAEEGWEDADEEEES